MNITISAIIIPKTRYDILVDESPTKKLFVMKKQSTGKRIAAAIEPSATILVIAINTKANTKQISPICQFVINNTPSAVATPLPPLNPKNIGNVCPSTTHTPAICIKRAAFHTSAFAIFPIKNATKTATTPFNTSHISVSIAGFFPAVLNTFVLPAFPLPFCLTSNPANFFVKIIEKLMLPNKYAIIAVKIIAQIMLSILPFSN